MKRLDDFRLNLAGVDLVPLVIGGMGVDISTTDLALEAARLGGIGHISDAMTPTVTDRRYKTKFVSGKMRRYKDNYGSSDKSDIHFDLDELAEAQRLHVKTTMDAKNGPGLVFINVMEKLGMNNPKQTLKVRLESALDNGIDGITLSAGLHLGSFALIQDHPRFRDAQLGIIVSSARALNLFLRKVKPLGRLPDFIVVEGPLAGGHLGFGMDWAKFDLMSIILDVKALLDKADLTIPIIPAGGIFTGGDATAFMEAGAAAVQVATRFTVTKECGLPDKVKQEYFKASEDNIEVNLTSPTGYPMRMLSNSPSIGAGNHPNCEAYGYLLDRDGYCAYIEAFEREQALHPGEKKLRVIDKTCLCTHMRKFQCWTCGAYTYRLKDTSVKRADGGYQVLSAAHVFDDYRYSRAGAIALPEAG